MYMTHNKDLDTFVVMAEETDSCYTCSCSAKCPLVFALMKETVVLRYEAMSISGCELRQERFTTKFKRLSNSFKNILFKPKSNPLDKIDVLKLEGKYDEHGNLIWKVVEN